MNHSQKIELLPLDAIIPYQRNARLHSSANIAKLSASIKEFGWTTPILVDEADVILAGHGRLLAARALLLEQVPCLRISGLSSAQKRAYRLADNRLTLDSDWDFEALRFELANLDFNLKLSGFNEQEIASILALANDNEWLGMPEFDQQDKTAFRSIVVHFKNQAALDEFGARLGAKITQKTHFIWFPEIEIEIYTDKQYVAEPPTQ